MTIIIIFVKIISDKMKQSQTDNLLDKKATNCERRNLVLYNDDFNTFEHVIKCLVEICGHTAEQAEQCALIVHFKGRYEVRTGSYQKLLPMKERMTAHNLTVKIE